MLYSVVYHMCF